MRNMTQKPRFFCAVCGAGFTREALIAGIAVRRYDRVFCPAHFRHQHPGECLNHPGAIASVRCAVCGDMVCENCALTLDGMNVCRHCKSVKIIELATGRWVTPRRGRRRFAKPDREVARRLYKHRYNLAHREWEKGRGQESGAPPPAAFIVMAAIMLVAMFLFKLLG